MGAVFREFHGSYH